MKRFLILLLAVLLLLSGIGCAELPVSQPTENTTVGSTDPSEMVTQPQPETAPTGTAPQTPTEQTQAPTTLPTQMSTAAQTQPTQPTEPTQATQPTQMTQSTQPTQMTQSTQPTQPTQVTQPTQPTQITQPTQPTQPAQPQETQGAVQTTEQPTDSGCQHNYQQTYTKAATCTAEGSKKFTCSKCGAVIRQTIPMKEHSYQAATCLKPKTCTACAHTEGTALGHSYGQDHICTRCGVKDGASSDEGPVEFAVTVRSDEGTALSGITVTVTADSGSASGITDSKGKVSIALDSASSRYTVHLSNVPEGYQAQSSYSFGSTQVTINLKSLPVRSDPNDHSKARYQVGDEMMDFTLTDVDGRTYKLSELLQENKLIILDFWYVSCNPCKQEFPYFEAALEAYGDDIILLAVDPFYSAADIRQLRDEMDLSFPVFQDPLGLSGGFAVESYPTTVFIDSTGTIRKIHRGAFSDEAAFLRAVEAYV